MKAITIRQPWATLIMLKEKQLETRSRQTKHRGEIAIHAGKVIDKEACNDYWIKSTLAKHGIKSYEDLPTGAVLGTANLVECNRVEATIGYVSVLSDGSTIEGLEVAFGDYTEGRYTWKLANVQAFEVPIEAKGQLSLWNWNNENK